MVYTDQPTTVSQKQRSQPQLLGGFDIDDHVSPTQVLDEAAIENEDDDYWDVQSDEEMFEAETIEDEQALLASKEFSNIRRIHLENYNELGIRRYDAFLYDGLLSHYRPEYAASPLRNPKTARVFAHYIHVVSSTGPLGRDQPNWAELLMYDRPDLHCRCTNEILETLPSFLKALHTQLSRDSGHIHYL